MPKTTSTYWNPLSPDNQGRWRAIDGLEGLAEELTLSMDHDSGEYTRLTRFLPEADTRPFGGKSHPYPEEIFIVSGRLYDYAFVGCGWKRVITPADRRERFMDRLEQRGDVWFLKSLSRINKVPSQERKTFASLQPPNKARGCQTNEQR